MAASDWGFRKGRSKEGDIPAGMEKPRQESTQGNWGIRSGGNSQCRDWGGLGETVRTLVARSPEQGGRRHRLGSGRRAENFLSYMMEAMTDI